MPATTGSNFIGEGLKAVAQRTPHIWKFLTNFIFAEEKVPVDEYVSLSVSFSVSLFLLLFMFCCCLGKMVGAMLALGSLLKIRNIQTTAFTKIVGVSMYYTGAERRFFTFCNQTGLCCSYDTVISLLDSRESSIGPVCKYHSKYHSLYSIF